MKTIAVIAARGGSKGIPRKNCRLMNGKPLIYYCINNALSCSGIDDVVVSSDDEEIRHIADMYGAETIDRNAELAGDLVTLDPVIYDAVVRSEEKHGYKYDYVITIQPTSPLLTVQTLQNALASFSLEKETDTYISGVNKPHLAWTYRDGKYIPCYEKRLNRQQLPPNYLEAGAFLISRRGNVTEKTRLGNNISIFEIPESEAVDIDSEEDWLVCEARLSRKHIVFRVDGYKLIGMGHVYRCLSLAQCMMGHAITFVMKKEYKEGIQKISSMNFKVVQIDTDEEFYSFLETNQTDVVVNDCLDSAIEYIQNIKKRTKRVVTIEDLGEGAVFADAVINALYQNQKPNSNFYCGERFICLRDEFLYASESQDKCCMQGAVLSKSFENNILVMFGGADPSDLTKRIYNIAINRSNANIKTRYNFITGPAYNCAEHGIVSQEDKGVYVFSDVKRISDFMREADLAITSQGRTVYELASIGVPSIVLAQNIREQLHTFAQMENGFLNLGLGTQVNDSTIESTIDWLLDTPGIRTEMVELQKKHDLADGIKRVKSIILDDIN